MSGVLSRACAEVARLARAAWRRFVEYCVLDDSQSRGLSLLKEWLTPELIFEEVLEVTHGGRGDERLLAREDKVTTYYHS